MAESGIEIDFLSNDEIEYDGQFGEVKSSSFVDHSLEKTEVKHASTPLKVNLKLQLQRQQAQQEQERQKRLAAARTSSSATSVSMPITVSALSGDVPQQVMLVKTGLTNPTRYHVQQKRNNQIQTFLSQSLREGDMLNTQSLPSAALGNISNIHPTSASSLPDPTSPLSAISSSAASCDTEVDDLLEGILDMHEVDPSQDQDLDALMRNFSSTLPVAGDALLTAAPTGGRASASAPAPNEAMAWVKDRQKKDNHNQIERRRRYNINDRIKELGTLLPSNSDPDFRQNKGTILKASVDYIRDLRKDQNKLRRMEEKVKEQDRNNRMVILRLQQCEMMLKQMGMMPGNTAGAGGQQIMNLEPPVVKQEPGVSPVEGMDDSPIAGDPMMTSALTSTQGHFTDDFQSPY